MRGFLEIAGRETIFRVDYDILRRGDCDRELVQILQVDIQDPRQMLYDLINLLSEVKIEIMLPRWVKKVEEKKYTVNKVPKI